MLFNSIPFLILFLVLYILFWKCPRLGIEGRKNLLLVASLVFYGWWSVPFLLHFTAVVSLNYTVYFFVQRPGKSMLRLLVALNLVHLAFFKYFYFLLDAASIALPGAMLTLLKPGHGLIPEIILPLGISFYTFQILAFHVDRYRETIDYHVSMKDFMLFIMFFPQLVAGPIMRHDELLPYLKRPVTLRRNWLDKGIFLFLIGVAKKVLIADNISPAIDPVFSNPSAYSSEAILTAVYGFAIQIYMDFSGYSDMARGLAYALGYRIPHNFRAPYFALSFREFWRRWHITLSQWLRDYLYIGLGGNRVSAVRNYFNLFATMVLGGLWHGANYTFIVWGALHGTYLVIERFFNLYPKPDARWPARLLRGLVVFHLVLLAWIFFRAPGMQGAFDIITGIISSEGTGKVKFPMNVGYILLATVVLHVYEYRARPFLRIWKWREWVLPVAVVVLGFLVMAFTGKSAPFIYFQF